MERPIDIKREKRSLRLFVAYPLPEHLWKYAEEVQERNSTLSSIRCTPFQNLHITLFFLGEVQEAALDNIKECIRKEVADSFSFKLEFESISLQHGRKHSGMIWMQFKRHPLFTYIASRLRTELQEYLNHASAIVDPIPHVTLARWKGKFETEKVNLQLHDVLQLPEINFCELWQSVTTADGVRYKRLEKFEMRKA